MNIEPAVRDLDLDPRIEKFLREEMYSKSTVVESVALISNLGFRRGNQPVEVIRVKLSFLDKEGKQAKDKNGNVMYRFNELNHRKLRRQLEQHWRKNDTGVS